MVSTHNNPMRQSFGYPVFKKKKKVRTGEVKQFSHGHRVSKHQNWHPGKEEEYKTAKKLKLAIPISCSST